MGSQDQHQPQQELGLANFGRGRWRVSSVEMTEEPSQTPGVSTVTVREGPAHEAAHLGLVFAALKERATEFPADLIGRQATSVLLANTIYGGTALDVREGRVAQASGGGLMMLPTGARSNGFRISEDMPMIVLEGHIGAELNTDPHLLAVPRPKAVDAATIAQLPDTNQLPWDEELPEDIRVTVSGVYRVLGQTVPGAVWSFTDRQGAASDPATILNGYLTVPEDSGLVSEHGSLYLGDLVNRHAMGVVPTPPGQTFGHLLKGNDPLLSPPPSIAPRSPDGPAR